MKTSLSLDRFEGKAKALAVLVADGGETIHVPRSFLPAGAKPGDVLSLSLEVDREATRELHAKTASLQDELGKTDPGGDLTL